MIVMGVVVSAVLIPRHALPCLALPYLQVVFQIYTEAQLQPLLEKAN